MATTNTIAPSIAEVAPAYHVIPAGVQLQLGDAPIPVTVTTPIVARDGGYTLDVTLGGAGLADGVYEVHLGPLGTTSDPFCYSGISGQGNAVEVINDQFSCISPILLIGGPYDFTFVNTDTQVGNVSEPAVTIVAHLVRSGTLKYRQLLPRTWRLGYRQIRSLGFPQL